jgi:quercetin dioxygenase-like cupin family protein
MRAITTVSSVRVAREDTVGYGDRRPEIGSAMTSPSGETHFSSEARGVPTGPGRFVKVADIDAVEFVPGLRFRPVLGERAMANFVSFEPNTVAPVHVHEEEQIVVVLEGEFEFELDGELRTMRPGDVAVIPPWVPHGARTLESPCLEVDVFTPPRRTLMEHARAAAERDG